jgi:hypothetical protein
MVGVAADVHLRSNAFRIDVIECPAVTMGLFLAERRGSSDLGIAEEAGFEEDEGE